jgi:hypothetical protein
MPPLQVAAGVYRVEFGAQTTLPQTVPLAGIVQPPLPSQVPVLPQVPPDGHWLPGAWVPAAMFEQVPAPFRLQAWQVPQVVVEQQTLSTQVPTLHSFVVEQPPPSPCLARQVPPMPVQ